MVCRECGARHFRLRVDPGHLGLRGGELGVTPVPVVGVFSDPRTQGLPMTVVLDDDDD
jgi:hypothetical protein